MFYGSIRSALPCPPARRWGTNTSECSVLKWREIQIKSFQNNLSTNGRAAMIAGNSGGKIWFALREGYDKYVRSRCYEGASTVSIRRIEAGAVYTNTELCYYWSNRSGSNLTCCRSDVDGIWRRWYIRIVRGALIKLSKLCSSYISNNCFFL